MKVWTARRPKRGDTERILCGRLVNGQHDCDAEIAYRYLYDSVTIPSGLTDEGSPQLFRWSRHAADRISTDQEPTDKRPGPNHVPDRGLVGTAKWIAELPKGSRRMASVPLTLPCPRKHMNAIDSTVLQD